MTRGVYGCRLNRRPARHPSEILADDINRAGLTREDVAVRSGIDHPRLSALILGDALPTAKESEALAAFLGREKRYYHKRATEWRDENS